eukprot:TRINITY_DN2213_c0_g1_i1.p1 TRINITY_DN2213_c0_g1~~TRINITY_DN2213_c0_g1_i1.p1  ORF type:complete len:376 (+),score=64.72 TRINITY_DN2213_c0_g1_i1:30-1157(+)
MRKWLELCCIFLSIISCSESWWEEGHLIVGQIAKDTLAEINEGALENCQLIVAALGKDYPLSPEIISASYWADDLKDFRWSAFDEWHYINKPFVPPTSNFTAPTDIPGQLPYALNQIYRALASFTESNFMGKAMMIRFLLHLIGDVHQPMHCTSEYSEKFPTGDRGGNSFYLRVNGTRQNMHAFFDSAAGLYDTRYHRPLNETGFEMLEKTSTDLAIEFPREDMIGLNRSDFEDLNTGKYAALVDVMIARSESLAISYGYLNGSLQLEEEVTAEYVQNAQSVCREQLARAGYTLAYMIESLLAKANIDYSALDQSSSSDPGDSDGDGDSSLAWITVLVAFCSLLVGILSTVAVGLITYKIYKLRKTSGYTSLAEG